MEEAFKGRKVMLYKRCELSGEFVASTSSETPGKSSEGLHTSSILQVTSARLDLPLFDHDRTRTRSEALGRATRSRRLSSRRVSVGFGRRIRQFRVAALEPAESLVTVNNNGPSKQ